MSTNFWELLQQHQGDLTKSGRTVAEYLVQHAAEAQYLSISSLARECQVAEATVFRFCRALGFEGYHEMRIALAQANATGVLVNQQEPAPDADTATLCEHASALFMTAINGKNYPVINGVVLFLSVSISLMNLLVDLVYGFVDPRIMAQYSAGRKKKQKTPPANAAGEVA